MQHVKGKTLSFFVDLGKTKKRSDSSYKHFISVQRKIQNGGETESLSLRVVREFFEISVSHIERKRCSRAHQLPI